MFVLELTYTAPIERVDELLEPHIAWLNELYESGVVIASGRKVPRDGGVILAVGDDRTRIEKIAAADPFVTGGVCEYRITEFIAPKTADELAPYRQQLPA
ncbi:YciI family protein [Streptomyces sannanensis]|uniref:YciI family protein n=1 Tax=Streptomyces sannanensis TaxID=285536 RepID=A0ABP6SJA7_9ACTN